MHWRVSLSDLCDFGLVCLVPLSLLRTHHRIQFVVENLVTYLVFCSHLQIEMGVVPKLILIRLKL